MFLSLALAGALLRKRCSLTVFDDAIKIESSLHDLSAGRQPASAGKMAGSLSGDLGKFASHLAASSADYSKPYPDIKTVSQTGSMG